MISKQEIPPTLRRGSPFRALLGSAALLVLAGCSGQPMDFDLRGLVGGFNTASAARQAVAPRPSPDARGVISYPNYQVAIARAGDRLADVAARVGLPAGELARYNGIATDTPLREGEVIALPRRIGESVAPAAGPGQSGIDITTLAEGAIDRAGGQTGSAPKPAPKPQVPEPVRHKVEPGETAYSIARLYNVSVKALAEWNGLGPDLEVRAGQYLLIPVVVGTAANGEKPGAKAAPLPAPPSASEPLPADEPPASTPMAQPKSPDLGSQQSAAESGPFMMPVKGKIIRPYKKKRNEGIDIAAPAGTPVLAARDGTVAAITRDTEQIPIIVIKHDENYLTVYAGVDNLKVSKGDRVKRGQQIAVVRAGNPSFVHFEIRQGLESIDPESLIR